MKMRLRGFLVLLGSILLLDASAQRAKDGSYTVTTSGDVLNTYTTLSANATAGASSISVANNSLTGGVFGGTALQQGDLILIIQMYGGTVDVNTWYFDNGWGNYTVPYSYGNWATNFGTDPQTFGQVLTYENVGKFERAEVVSVSGSNTINLSCGLDNDYTATDGVQIVRIPRLNDLTVNGGASIVPTLWNGSTGGVVALEVDGTLTINAGGSISASAFGYRGGQVDGFFSPGLASTDVSNPERFLGSPVGTEGSQKGESIYGYLTEYDAIQSRYGKGAIANGGGGGGYVNSGGGGGSNAEIAPVAYNGHGNPDNSTAGYVSAWALDASVSNSSGGGRGGYCLSQSNQNATTLGPTNSAWGGDARKNNGGWGGHPLTYDATRLFFGGGGGAGEQDSGQGGSGGRGGGIVYIVNYGSIAGSGTIEVNGEDGQNSNPNNETPGFNQYRGNDGAGGGGAGGSVYIENATAIPASININADGGNGGDQNLILFSTFMQNEAGGPGGSGSGGVIRFSSGSPTQSVAEGVNGVTTSTQLSEFPPNGATMGSTGEANLPAPYYDLIPNDVSICAGQTAAPSVTVSGSLTGTIEWYTQQFGGTPIPGQSGQTTYNVSPGTTTTYYVGVCPGSFRVPVTVTVTPGPTLLTTDPAPLCSPATADLTLPAVTAGSDPGTLTYWQDNNATVVQSTPTAVGGGWHYIQLDAGGGCAIIDSVFVTINPQDDASFTSTDFCEASVNTISGVATPGGTFSIQSQTGSGTVTINSSTGILSNYTAGDQVTIQYTTSGACPNSSTQVVNVIPSDDATFTSGDFCESSVNTISGVATPGGTFSIQSQTGSMGVTINSSTGVLANYTAGDQVTIQYATPAGPCQTSSTQVVNVLPTEDASFTSNDFCESTVNTISGVATPGGTYSIQSQTGSMGATINATTGVLSNFAGGDQVTIQYTTSGTCPNSSTQVVNVIPLDDASFTSNDFCESTVNTISGVATPGGTFSIQSQTGSMGATINASTGVLSNFVAGDQVTIQYTTAGACANSSTQVVNVLPTDDASFTSNDFCASSVNTISGVATPGGTFSIQSQTGSMGVTINASTGILSNYIAGDQITILYTTAGTCPNSSTQVVNVTNLDDASFTSNDFCESSVNTISGVATPGGTFSIQSQTGSMGVTINSSTGILSNYTAGDQVTIQYTTGGACSNSSTQVVNVNASDDASFTTSDFCEFTVNTVSGIATPGGTFSIQSQTGSMAATINASTGVLSNFTAGDQVTIQYTTSGACSNSSTQVVNVLPTNDASFTSNDFCASSVNTISGVATPGGTFSIQSQTGSMGVTINASTGILSNYLAGDQITIQYTTAGACPNSSTQVVNVTNLDDASFTSNDFCESSVNTISGVTTPGGTFSIQSQTGSMGVTINASTGVLSNFVAGDQITIQYTTGGACSNSSTQVVNVLQLDDASFTSNDFCESTVNTISGVATPGGTFSIQSQSGSMGVTINPSTGVLSNFVGGDQIQILYTTAGACPNSSWQFITVNPTPVINTTAVPISGCNLSDGGITVSDAGNSMGTVSWTGPTSGNSGLVVLPYTITGLQAGTYDVTFTNGTTACASAVSQVTLINPSAPNVDPIAAMNDCDSVQLPAITGTNLSGNQAYYDGPNGTGTQYAPGDWISSTMTLYAYDISGSCSDEESFNVTIYGIPVAAFTANPTSGCTLPHTVFFTDNSTLPDTWLWDFGDLNTSTAQNPIHSYTGYGTYTVTLTVTDTINGCSDQATATITVNTAPVLDPVSNMSNCDSIQLPIISGSNLSGSEAYYSGSGGTGTMYNAGDWVTSTQTLYVYDASNVCSNEESFTATVNVSPTVSGTNTVCIGSTTALSGTGTPDGTTPWSSSNTGIATVDNAGVVTGVSAGTSTITYLDANGCSNTMTVTVDPLPTISGTPAVCEGATTALTGSGTPNGTTPWSSSNTLVATVDNAGTVTGVSAGSATITYMDDNGCTIDQVVTVNAPDDASFTSSDFCESTVNTISGVVTPGGTFSIQSQTGSGTATIDASTGVLSNFTAGDQIVIEYTTPAAGCQNSSTQTVNVLPLDDASFTSADFCESSVNTISNVATPGGTFSIQSQTGSMAVTINASTGVLSNYTAGDQVVILYTTSGAGCQNSSTVTVNVTALDDASFTTSDFCESSVNVISGVASPGGTFAIQSQTGSATIDASTGVLSNVAGGDQITIEYTTPSGACQNTSTQTIDVLPSDDGSFTMTATCDGGTANISGLSGGTFAFNTPPGDAAVIDASTGTVTNGTSGSTYNVDYTTNGACPVTVTQPVTALDQDDASFMMTATCDGGTATILGDTGGTFGFSAAPSDGAVIDATTGTVTGGSYNSVYTVQYTTAGTCPASSNETVVVDDCTPTDIIIPTAFTPGGDGANDTWEIVDLDNVYPDNHVIIYNRWGNKVFEHQSSAANPYSANEWDGTYNGGALPVASYYYIIEANDGSGEKFEGTVTIVQ